jgi:hypothetical protein
MRSFSAASRPPRAYTQIARWNGPLANFTLLADKRGPQFGVNDGDIVRAFIIGDVITAYINGVQMAKVSDDTFSSGNPGIGLNYGCNGTYQNFGFRNFTARGIGAKTKTNAFLKPLGLLSLQQILNLHPVF